MFAAPVGVLAGGPGQAISRTPPYGIATGCNCEHPEGVAPSLDRTHQSPTHPWSVGLKFAAEVLPKLLPALAHLASTDGNAKAKGRRHQRRKRVAAQHHGEADVGVAGRALNHQEGSCTPSTFLVQCPLEQVSALYPHHWICHGKPDRNVHNHVLDSSFYTKST